MPDPDLTRQPDFRHRFVLHDGEVIVVPHRQARRVVDRRADRAQPETLWEVTLDSGLVRRIWMSEIRSWTQEPL